MRTFLLVSAIALLCFTAGVLFGEALPADCGALGPTHTTI